MFGMTEEEVSASRQPVARRPVLRDRPVLQAGLDAISHGDYTQGQSFTYGHAGDSLLAHDPVWCWPTSRHTSAQDEVEKAGNDLALWGSDGGHNIARLFLRLFWMSDYLTGIVPAVP